MITEIEDFFRLGCGRCDRFSTPQCSARKWAKGLKALRELCLDAGLVETVKWGHPCYMHAECNIVLIGALREEFRLNFFNASLLKDPEGILEKQGPNTQHPDSIRFTADAQVTARAKTLRAYIAEAMKYTEKGLKPKKERAEVELPPELEEALEHDSELAEAFRNLTPGRQRSYVIQLNAAKKPETKISRIVGFRPKILAGKGAQDR